MHENNTISLVFAKRSVRLDAEKYTEWENMDTVNVIEM